MTKYIGMDAHSSSCNLCVMDVKGRIMDEVEIATNGRLLINYLRSIGGERHIVFEECEISSWLHELLKPEVKGITVCNPAKNGKYKRNKTDKLDARELANLLRGGFLSGVYHDSSDREKLRSIVSSYQDIVEEGVRLKNRYKSLFRRRGQNVRGKSLYNDESLLEGLDRPDFKFIGRHIYHLLEELEAARQDYLKEMIRLVKKFKESRYIKTIPGFGNIQTAKLISQIVNPGRFANKYKLNGYACLARHKYESGGKEHGSQKIYGNKILKCVYKMSAHSAIRGSNGLRKYYDRLRTKGLNHEKALNSVARKIAAISLALWKKGENYNDKLLADDLIK